MRKPIPEVQESLTTAPRSVRPDMSPTETHGVVRDGLDAAAALLHTRLAS